MSTAADAARENARQADGKFGTYSLPKAVGEGPNIGDRLADAQAQADAARVQENRRDLADLVRDLPVDSVIEVLEWPEEPYDDGTYDVSLSGIHTPGSDNLYGVLDCSMIAGHGAHDWPSSETTTDFDDFMSEHPRLGRVLDVEKVRRWDKAETLKKIDSDVEEYGEHSNVFRPITEVHNDYKSRDENGTWRVMAMGHRGTVLTPHRGPQALDAWYASKNVFGPERPAAARKAISEYLEAKAAVEDRPWDHDNKDRLARAKRIRDGYSDYGDDFASH